MKETSRIMELMQRTFDGQAWHGPSLMEVIRRIDPEVYLETSSRHHTPAELLSHIIFWREGALKMLRGEEVDAAADWQANPNVNAPEWRELINKLRASHTNLLNEVEKINEEQLHNNVPGKDFSYYVLLHGVIQHDIYHSGQLAIISKLLK